MAMNKEETQAVFRELGENRALTYFLGSVMLSLGTAVTVLSFRPTTLPGWLAFGFGCIVMMEGTSFLVLRGNSIEKYLATMESDLVFYSIAIGYIALAIMILGLG